MTLGLVCDACDALSPVAAADCVHCGNALGVVHGRSSGPHHPAFVADVAAGGGATPGSNGTPEAAAFAHSGRICGTCGAEVPANHRFCGECGSRLDGPAAAPSAGKTLFFSPIQEGGRARLILVKGEGLDSVSYHLAGSEHVVGHSEGEILFPDDPLVSPRHANFFYRGSSLFVRDEDSRNGVFLRIRHPVRLQPNQPFLVGEQLLVVQAASIDGLAAADAEGTYYYGSPRRPARIRVLQVLAGGDVGMAMRVGGDVMSIGREGNHINFPDDPFISGHHAQVAALDDGGFRLTDVGSKNGTFVRTVGETRLDHGDYVFLGQQLLRIEIV